MLDEPVDRFAQSAELDNAASTARGTGAAPSSNMATNVSGGSQQRTPPPSQAQPVQVAPQRPTAIPGAEAIEAARALAREANTMDALNRAIQVFEGCNLRFTAKATVCGAGKADARLMVIGEQPNNDEENEAMPMAGTVGVLFDRMMASIGLSREELFITPAIPWRTPGSRPPSPPEMEICRPFLLRQLELVNPDMVLLMGGLGAQLVLQQPATILSLRGKWQEVALGDTALPCLPTLSPHYLLRMPSHKRMAWHDLLALKKRLAQ